MSGPGVRARCPGSVPRGARRCPVHLNIVSTVSVASVLGKEDLKGALDHFTTILLLLLDLFYRANVALLYLYIKFYRLKGPAFVDKWLSYTFYQWKLAEI